MFPTVKLALTRALAPKHPLAAILLLLHLPATASINRALPARRALTIMANLSTLMDLTVQDLITNVPAGEELVSASTNVLNAAAEAFGFNELRTRGTRTRMTQQQAAVATVVTQPPLADLAARMRQDPGVIRRRILLLPAVTKVTTWDL